MLRATGARERVAHVGAHWRRGLAIEFGGDIVGNFL